MLLDIIKYLIMVGVALVIIQVIFELFLNTFLIPVELFMVLIILCGVFIFMTMIMPQIESFMAKG